MSGAMRASVLPAAGLVSSDQEQFRQNVGLGSRDLPAGAKDIGHR